jgi:hypothetical protein
MKKIRRFFRELFGKNKHVYSVGDADVTLENVYNSTVKIEYNGNKTEFLTDSDGKVILRVDHDNDKV